MHLSSKDYASFSEISSIGQLLHQCPMWETGFDEHSETDDENVADGVVEQTLLYR